MTQKKSRKTNYAPYLFLAPFFIIFIAFSLFPMLYSLYISFMKWDGVNEMTFAGVKNYIRLFTHDPLFYKSIWNTLVVIVLAIPLQMIFGLVMAVLLKDFFSKSRTALQFINYTPNITNPVAVGIIFAILFDSRVGTINQILGKFGISAVNWLGEEMTARIVVIILLVWKYFGYMMVMFLAGLSAIPDHLYEAAQIDGANYFQRFRYITIPGLKPTFIFLSTTSVISGLQLFSEPQLLFSKTGMPAGPGDSVLTSIMYMYDTAFKRFDFGYGAAVAYGIFLIIMLLSIPRIRQLTRKEEM